MTTNQTIFAVLPQAILTLFFWQTWWFKSGVLFVLCGGSVFLYVRSRIGRLKNEIGDLQRRLSERAELLEYSSQREKKSKELEAQANHSKSLLLVRINHEIRTPLNGVLGMASLLGETSLTAEQKEYSDTIKECGDSLLKVVNDILFNDILDYAKVASGKMELEQKDFDLENSIEDVLELFAGKAAQNQVELIYQIDAAVPTQIVGDNLRLRQILTNIIENSIRYTSEGEIMTKVRLASTGVLNEILLSFEVSDSGTGISPDKLKSILNGFNDTDVQNKKGVGLAISYKLIELMGGTLTMESQVGKGTTVTFTIKTVASSVLLHGAHKLAALDGKRVMVVENNKHLAEALERQLRQLKLVPVMACSGKEALGLLEKSPVDLVLTDLSKPEVNGMEHMLAMTERFPQLPFILLAPAGDHTSKQHPGIFTSVLSKPVKKHLLTKQILSAILHVDSDALPEGNGIRKLSSNFAEQHPLRILIAEDNLTNQKLATKVLSKLGYVADMAQHGKEVLEMVSHKNYDVILMDVQMPEMDGMEASRMIRLCLSVQPVIIAMTANTLQGDREDCLKAGMDDYIGKPINLEELVDVLEKWAIHIKEKQ